MLVFTIGKRKEKCQFLLYVGRCKGKTDICQFFLFFFSMNLSLIKVCESNPSGHDWLQLPPPEKGERFRTVEAGETPTHKYISQNDKDKNGQKGPI